MTSNTTPTELAAESIAEAIHKGMVWGAKQGGDPKPWQGGNSLAEEEARRIAASLTPATDERHGPDNDPWFGNPAREGEVMATPATDERLAERLMDDEALSLRIIDRAWQDAGLSGRPFFGEACEPGAAIASIVRQVTALAPEQSK